MDFGVLLTLGACFSVHNLVIQECFVFCIMKLGFYFDMVTDNTWVGLVLTFQRVQILFALNHQDQSREIKHLLLT